MVVNLQFLINDFQHNDFFRNVEFIHQDFRTLSVRNFKEKFFTSTQIDMLILACSKYKLQYFVRSTKLSNGDNCIDFIIYK